MKIIIILLSIIIIYLFFLLSEKNPYNSESFGGQKEFANLQNINDGMGNKQQLNNRLFLVSFNGSEVLIITSKHNKYGILLNCEYPPYYKAFGKYNDFKLTLEEFQLIRKHRKITTTVQDLLSLHIK